MRTSNKQKNKFKCMIGKTDESVINIYSVDKQRDIAP